MSLFISYAASDGWSYPEPLAAALKALGRDCWFALRDQKPGLPYPDQIVTELGRSDGVILLLTPGANASAHVKSEVEIAVDLKRIVAPVSVDGTPPSGELRYFLGRLHRIPWTGPDEVANRLVATFGPSSAESAVANPPASPPNVGARFRAAHAISQMAALKRLQSGE